MHREFSFFVIALLISLASPHTMFGSIIVSDNLGQPAIVDESAAVSTTTWLASSFSTGSIPLMVEYVTLLIQQSPGSNSAVAAIYSDKDFVPGELVGTLISPDNYPNTLEGATFMGNGVYLNPSSTYWVVLHAITGEFMWAYSSSIAGTGEGFQHTYGYSWDSGNSWGSGDTYPQMMQVAADPVPLPGTIWLFGSGLVGLFFYRKK